MWDSLLPKAKQILAIEDIEADRLVKMLLQYVEGFIYSSYGIAIEDRLIEEYVDAEFGNNILYTSNGVIREVSLFEIDAVDNLTDLLAKSFFKFNSIRLLKSSSIVLNASSEYHIKYNIGYTDVSQVPYGLLNAFLHIVKKVYNNITKNTDGYAAISTGVKETVHIEDSIPLIALETLQSYKVYRL